MRLKGCDPWPKAASVRTVEGRVNSRIGHSGPSTAAKCVIRGISTRSGRVSTITATLSPTLIPSEIGVVARFNLESRFERLASSSDACHQYVARMNMTTKEMTAAVIARLLVAANMSSGLFCSKKE